jgi:hypothetical protein
MSRLVRVEDPIEVPPSARPRGFIYLHSTQLDERLELGDRVEFRDEVGERLTARVVDETHDRLGARYRLRLGDEP